MIGLSGSTVSWYRLSRRSSSRAPRRLTEPVRLAVSIGTRRAWVSAADRAPSTVPSLPGALGIAASGAAGRVAASSGAACCWVCSTACWRARSCSSCGLPKNTGHVISTIADSTMARMNSRLLLPIAIAFVIAAGAAGSPSVPGTATVHAVQLVQCQGEVLLESVVGPGQAFAARDDHIVMPAPRPLRQNLAGRFPEPAPGAVAFDRAADALGCGKADPRLSVLPPCHHLQHQARRRPFAALRRPEEIRTSPEPLHQGDRRACRAAARQALRRLRPFARRAASTRRPPTVAIRARKPWRRLRLILLG